MSLGGETEKLIKIYGVSLALLPDRRALMNALTDSLYASWREKHKSIRDERAARASLAGVLLLQFAGIDGSIVYDASGRPRLENQELDFNITHTEQLVFCAIESNEPLREDANPQQYDAPAPLPYPSKEVPPLHKRSLFANQFRVGIDAENISRLSNMRVCPLADRWFSENEHEFFLSAPNDITFLRVWTRKEALVKWTGEGLTKARAADTVTAESVYGIRFSEYRVSDAVVTLCTHRSALTPSSVHMLTPSEVLKLI